MVQAQASSEQTPLQPARARSTCTSAHRARHRRRPGEHGADVEAALGAHDVGEASAVDGHAVEQRAADLLRGRGGVLSSIEGNCARHVRGGHCADARRGGAEVRGRPARGGDGAGGRAGSGGGHLLAAHDGTREQAAAYGALTGGAGELVVFAAGPSGPDLLSRRRQVHPVACAAAREEKVALATQCTRPPGEAAAAGARARMWCCSHLTRRSHSPRLVNAEGAPLEVMLPTAMTPRALCCVPYAAG